jgi:hypothetical protein
MTQALPWQKKAANPAETLEIQVSPARAQLDMNSVTLVSGTLPGMMEIGKDGAAMDAPGQKIEEAKEKYRDAVNTLSGIILETRPQAGWDERSLRQALEQALSAIWSTYERKGAGSLLIEPFMQDGKPALDANSCAILLSDALIAAKIEVAGIIWMHNHAMAEIHVPGEKKTLYVETSSGGDFAPVIYSGAAELRDAYPQYRKFHVYGIGEKNPMFSDARAKHCLGQGRYENAIAYAEISALEARDNPVPRITLADIYRAMHKEGLGAPGECLALAKKSIAEASALAKKNGEYLAGAACAEREAWAAAASGDFASAARLLGRSMATFMSEAYRHRESPLSGFIWNTDIRNASQESLRIGKERLSAGDYENASQFFRIALPGDRLTNDEKIAHANLAESCARCGERRAAESYAAQAYGVPFSRAQAWLALGISAYEGGEYRLAGERYRQSAILGPDNASAYAGRAQARLRSGNMEGAAADIEAAFAAGSRNTDAFVAKAELDLVSKDYDGALSALGNAIARRPEDWRLYELRAEIFQKKGDHKKMVENYKLARDAVAWRKELSPVTQKRALELNEKLAGLKKSSVGAAAGKT